MSDPTTTFHATPRIGRGWGLMEPLAWATGRYALAGAPTTDADTKEGRVRAAASELRATWGTDEREREHQRGPDGSAAAAD